LYRLTPEDFVHARDSLAKTVKAEGDASTAAQVRELRRPTVGAWLVNQLVRQRPDEIDELLETAESLRSAQVAVLGGKGNGALLQELAAVRRSQIDALVAEAGRIASEAGRKSAPLDAVDSTLVAATSDENAGAAVRSGRLVKELSYSGFGLSENLSDAVAPSLHVVRAPARKAAKAGSTRAGDRDRDKDSGRGGAKSDMKAAVKSGAESGKASESPAEGNAAERRHERAVADATGAVKAAQADVQDASGEADDAQRTFEAAQAELASLHDEVERLASALSEARSALIAAQRRHDKTRGAAKIAHAEADRQRAALVKAESLLGRLTKDQ
jgi:hypothetical protein